jgi:hypothetical protein
MRLYTIYAKTEGAWQDTDYLSLMAEGHRQKSLNNAVLVGVSKAGVDRLEDFLIRYGATRRITFRADYPDSQLVGLEPGWRPGKSRLLNEYFRADN